jgi:hypothetical protein
MVAFFAIGILLVFFTFVNARGDEGQGVNGYYTYTFESGLEPVFHTYENDAWICRTEEGVYRDCQPTKVWVNVD